MARAAYVDIQGSMRKIERDLWMVSKKHARRAAARALNDTAVTLRKTASQEAGKAAKIPIPMMKRHMPIGKANFRRLSVPLYLHLRGISAASLDPKRTATGVRAKPNHVFEGAFYLEPGHESLKGRTFKQGIVLRRRRDDPSKLEAMRVEHAHISQPIMDEIILRTGHTVFIAKFTSRMRYQLKQAARGK